MDGTNQTLSASATITATVTSAPGATLPAAVIVEQVCAVGRSGGSGATGGCSNPLGGSNTALHPAGATCAYISYTFMSHPGATLGPYSCAPAANVSIPNGVGGGVSVEYRVAVYPVSINLGGTTPDGSGNLNILIGQHCTASLAGVPGTGRASNFQWSVSDSSNTFQTWSATTPAVGTAPANPNATYYVAGPGPLNIASPAWYWNDPSQTQETVSCTATVTPTIQGTACTVTASQQVTVMVPDFTAIGIGGYMQVNQYDPNISTYALWAGPTAQEKANGQNGGMHWQLSVTTPSMPAFGLGRLELVQTTKPNDSYTTDTNPPQSRTDPLNGIEGLDGVYPYASAAESSGVPLIDDDEPGLVLIGTTYQAGSATFKASFIDYLMYEPPNSSQFVPLAMFTWSTDGSADIPQPQDSWASYSMVHGGDAAGTVKSDTSFTPGNTFPAWTHLDKAVPY